MLIVNTLSEFNGEGREIVSVEVEQNNSLEMIDSLLKCQNIFVLNNMVSASDKNQVLNVK